MTTYLQQIQVCCLCGTENACTVLGSTNSMGSPDLDLRPPPMERDTMKEWFQECKSCRYVSVDLALEMKNAQSIVDSDEYQALLADSELPEIARRFALCALLNSHDRCIAGTALLRSAWVCDDEAQADLAKSFRSQSADMLKKLQPFEDDEEQATVGTMLIDVLRRSERFDEAAKMANQLLKFKAVKRSDVMMAVVKYQLTLCESGSSVCHQIEEAIEAKS